MVEAVECCVPAIHYRSASSAMADSAMIELKKVIKCMNVGLSIENKIKIIELLVFYTVIMGMGMVNCMVNIEFQLSEPFAYPNTGISGAG